MRRFSTRYILQLKWLSYGIKYYVKQNSDTKKRFTEKSDNKVYPIIVMKNNPIIF